MAEDRSPIAAAGSRAGLLRRVRQDALPGASAERLVVPCARPLLPRRRCIVETRIDKN